MSEAALRQQLTAALPAAAVALLIGVTSGAWGLAAALALAAVAAAAVGPRWELDRGRQLVASVIGLGVAYTLVSLLFESQPGGLSEGWVRLSSGLLLAAAARFVQPRPAGGPAATAMLLLVAALLAGESRTRDGSYSVASVVFVVGLLVALRAGDPARPRLRAGAAFAAASILLLAAAMGAGMISGVRSLNAWLTNRAKTTALGFRVQTGFSDQMDLGSLNGLLDSETMVMRLRGPRVDYLRGAVFDVYEVGRWRRSDKLASEEEQNWSGTQLEGEAVELQAIPDSLDRFFLPLEARLVAPSPPAVKVDAFGIVKRQGKGDALSARFTLGPRERATLVRPNSHDLFIPHRIHARLDAMVAGWVAGETTPAGKLDAIERHLSSDFRYSRSFRRDQDFDPAIDFLTKDRTGHCEYFATGMVLAARSARVPARVVTGYRVAERSPFGGYFVVREKNAHAWVEAWIDGQWVTRDPTPSELLPQNQPHEAGKLSAALDLLRLRYDELAAWVGKRTALQLTAATVAGLLVLVWLVARGVQRRSKGAAVPDDERPLPFLRELLLALEKDGHGRAPHEPLDALAARLPDPEASSLLLRYEALRYGGVGDAAQLEALARACTRRLREASPARP